MGRSLDGRSTGIGAVVDDPGLPVRLLITPGQASDRVGAPGLLDGLPAADALVYRKRNLVERFFCRIKQFHPMATCIESASMVCTRPTLLQSLLNHGKLEKAPTPLAQLSPSRPPALQVAA